MPSRRTYASVYYDGRTRIQNNTPVNNFNPQGTAKGFLDILALEMERLYDSMEVVYQAIDPTRAIGRDLDKIGFLVGENRRGAVTASDVSTTNFYFYVDKKLNWTIRKLVEDLYTTEEIAVLDTNGYITRDATGAVTAFTIPRGTVVTNTDGTITYQTTDDVDLEGQSNAYVGVIALGTGPSYNVDTNILIVHSLTQVPELRKMARYIKCTNRYPIQNGSYTQTDEEYRYRIATSRNAIQSNELFIRRTALSVPGVRDILFEKNKYGSGTVNIIVDAVSPLASDGLIASVRESVQAGASYGDVIYVTRPEYLGVRLDFAIVIEPGNPNPLALRNAARNNVIQYVNDLSIGGEVIWNEIVASVLSVEGITDFVPNFFKYGKYDVLNKINKEEVVLRYVNQKARYNEKWYSDTGLVSACIA